MFEKIKNQPISGANNFVAPTGNYRDDEASGKKKKIFWLLLIIVLLFVLGGGFWWFFYGSKSTSPVSLSNPEASSSVPARLDGVSLAGGDTGAGQTNGTKPDEMEYLSFADFYPTTTPIVREYKFAEYALPLNVKVDVANYHDISRKLSLEKSLNDLNNHGFAVLDNPWPKDQNNFYALANTLDDQQIPLFISADFISYYYQSILKKTFKDVEEGVFYDSLREINQKMYEAARSRYETHLAAVGNINDRILEGERLETAFFAVSLELLAPRAEQVDPNNKAVAGKFSQAEQKEFAFSVPSYLNDDVLKELELIRAAKETKKSPVLLYDRDYRAFSVPTEYKNNARLQNFYLAAVWLNSVFPLNYREDSCKDCLLDKDDWRINFTAACLIAQDFAKDQALKNEWARVYKTISFFKGLRDSWNYVNYLDGLKKLFGNDYDIVALFAESDADAGNNMEKLRQALLSREVLPMQGGFDLKNMAGFKQAGLQFLADFYWPNDFIFGSLRYPQVGAYRGGDKPGKNNVTACPVSKKYQRCQGSGQDIIGLIYPVWQGAVFTENSNYANYTEAINKLRPLVQSALNEHLNNYWSSLLAWQAYLNIPEEHLPIYLRTEAWRSQMTAGALGAWTDMQLPLDKLDLKSQAVPNASLSAASNTLDYSWVDPNLDFLDRLLNHNQMLLNIFKALGLDRRSSLAVNRLSEAERQLTGLRTIAEKEAKGESLNSDDTQFIRDFAKTYILEQGAEKSVSWNNVALKANLKETLGIPRLLIIAHPAGEKTVFAVGPVFNYQESR